jgi:hypothetical protein
MALCNSELETRRCKKCNATKSLDLFQKRPTCLSGYGYTCKECANEYNKVKAKRYYYANHDEELQKKREYREANKDRINQQTRERRREKRAEQRAEKQKELPDFYLDYIDNDGNPQSIKLSELTDEHYKAMYYNNLTVKLLMLIAKRFNIDIHGLYTKDKFINHLIDHGILSENALTQLVPANGEFYKSDTETQCKHCLLIKPNDELYSTWKCKDCKKIFWSDNKLLNKIPWGER